MKDNKKLRIGIFTDVYYPSISGVVIAVENLKKALEKYRSQTIYQYLEPVMRDIEAMLTESQRNVNGTAILELRPYGFSTVGVESKDDLVKNKFGEYGEMQKGWTAEDAKGFIKVLSTPLRAYYANHKDEADV